MLRAVCFDLDGTLFDRDSSVRRLVARQYDVFAAALAPLPGSTFVERFMALDERGYVPKPRVYRSLLAEAGLDERLAAPLFDYFEAHYHHSCLLAPGAASALERLRGQGYALGIITNGGFPWQLRTVQALGIEPYFGAILVSGAEGVRKPDAAIFQRALERLGVAAGEAVFVGDHPLVDVAGARRAGLRAIWKREPFWSPPAEADAVVDDLVRLPELIDELAERGRI